MFQTLYIALLALTCLWGLGVAYSTWKNRTTTGANALVVLCLAAVIWAGGTIGLTMASTPAVELRWLQLSYIGIVGSPIAFVVLAVIYTGAVQSVPTRLIAGLGGCGLVFLGFVWTNPYHQLYWADIDYTAAVPEGLTTIPGPGFWAFVVFTYVLLIAGSYVFIKHAITARGLYRLQTAMLLLAVAAPWVANIPHSLQLMAADFTPISLSVTVGAIWVAMFRYRLTDVDPVALRTVFESISPAVLVLDQQNRVGDINSTGMDLFDVSSDVIGDPLEAVVSQRELYKLLQQKRIAQEPIKVGEQGSDERFYEVSVTPTETSRLRQDSRVVVLNDITAYKEQQQRLEEQNQRLDQFTSVVSHDLRNPLNIAQGYLEIVRTESDSKQIARVYDAHERMAELIDDLLVLAKSGEDLSELQPVSVSEILRRTWSNVETHDATLTVGIDRTIIADVSRLQQLFENLIRNSIDHGGTDVDIVVGELDNGFYVEDSGPGISESNREQIFETGYSSNNGTGLGMDIVRQIVEGHGWSITVTAGSDGGARFEMRHVEFTGSTET